MLNPRCDSIAAGNLPDFEGALNLIEFLHECSQYAYKFLGGEVGEDGQKISRHHRFSGSKKNGQDLRKRLILQHATTRISSKAIDCIRRTSPRRAISRRAKEVITR